MTAGWHDASVTDRAARYLAHLDRLSGGSAREALHVPSGRPGRKGVTVLRYPDLPPGLSTALTYGLSLGDHPDWTYARPELCLSMRSQDPAWARMAGQIAEDLAGECPFMPGDTIDVGEPIVDGTRMTAFLIAAPAVVEGPDARVELGDDDLVVLAGLYPIHETEQEFVRTRGLEAFLRLPRDPYDPSRLPAV